MTPDITICRTSNEDCYKSAGGDWRCSGDEAHTCDPVPMVWSADGHALLEVVECDECVHGEVYNPEAMYSVSPCPKCGGSGWKYAAHTEEVRHNNPEIPDYRIVVVPLKAAEAQIQLAERVDQEGTTQL